MSPEPPSPPAAAERAVLSVETRDGISLAVERIPAAGSACGAAWISHAMMANRRSLDRPRGAGLASRVAAAGIHVYLADLRGHGGSRPPAPRWRYDDIVREDLPALTRFVASEHPGLPIAGIGHSLAGHAALAAQGLAGAGERALDAIVTIGANIWLRSFEPSPLRWAEKRLLAAGFLAVARAWGRFPARALGVGSEDVSLEFVEDTARFVASGRWAARDGTDYLAALGRVRAPVLAVLGAGDRILCSPAAGARFHARAAAAPLDILVAGRPALPFDPGHMGLVTDPRARPLWDEIARWLCSRLLLAAARAGPGAQGPQSPKSPPGA